MSAPKTRMGFKQASAALRPYSLRVCRVENCPNLSGSAKFGAVPLRKGLSDQAVTVDDVKHWADTMSELVELVVSSQTKTKTETKTETETETNGSKWTGSDYPLEGGQDKPPAPTADADKLRALQTLLGSGVDEKAVEATVRKVAGAALEEAKRDSTDKINTVLAAAKQTSEDIESRIEDACRKAAGAVPTKVEIKTPERTKIVEGQHHEFPCLVEEMGFGNSILIKGPAGSGKTTAVRKAAEALDRASFMMRAVNDPFELLGFIDAAGNYQPSPIYRWAETPGAVLIMDEIDRSNPKALIALNSAWNDVISFPTGEVRVPAENLIVATANTWGVGTDAEYVGSARLDGATLNRFPSRIDWGYDEGLEARIVEAAGGDVGEVQFCQKIRAAIQERKVRVIWSPRDTVAYCLRLAKGVSRSEALRRSVLATLDETTFKAVTK